MQKTWTKAQRLRAASLLGLMLLGTGAVLVWMLQRPTCSRDIIDDFLEGRWAHGEPMEPRVACNTLSTFGAPASFPGGRHRDDDGHEFEMRAFVDDARILMVYLRDGAVHSAFLNTVDRLDGAWLMHDSELMQRHLDLSSQLRAPFPVPESQ